jgi:acyl carrier protein
MSVRDRVFNAFKESFDLDDGTNTSKLVYQAYPAWTSIGHMILVAALESEFDTMLETDDILEMRKNTSYRSASKLARQISSGLQSFVPVC